MPLPYPLPPPPPPPPGSPPGPHDPPDPAPRRTAVPVHPQHQVVPLTLGVSAMYYGMLSWRPEDPALSRPSHLSGPVLPVLFR